MKYTKTVTAVTARKDHLSTRRRFGCEKESFRLWLHMKENKKCRFSTIHQGQMRYATFEKYKV